MSLIVENDGSPLHRRNSANVGTLHQLPTQQELRKALECPICKEVPLAPIYTCSIGHTICGRCRIGKKCGICSEDVSNSRNAAVELIVANSSFWCKYQTDGCKMLVKGSEYKSHSEECDYRRIECNEWELIKCKGTPIRFKEYFNHLKRDHQIEGFEMNNTILPMSEYSNDLRTDGPWPAYYFYFNGEVFLRNMKIEKSIIYWWFTYIGTPEEAASYRLKLTVLMRKDNKWKLDWILPVYSIRTSQKELEEISLRAAIPSKQLELMCERRQHPHGEIFNFVMDLKYEIMSA